MFNPSVKKLMPTITQVRLGEFSDRRHTSIKASNILDFLNYDFGIDLDIHVYIQRYTSFICKLLPILGNHLPPEPVSPYDSLFPHAPDDLEMKRVQRLRNFTPSPFPSVQPYRPPSPLFQSIHR